MHNGVALFRQRIISEQRLRVENVGRPENRHEREQTRMNKQDTAFQRVRAARWHATSVGVLAGCESSKAHKKPETKEKL